MLFSLLEQLAKTHSVSMLLTKNYDPAFVERYRAAGVRILNTASSSHFDIFLVNTILGASSVLAAKGKLPVTWWIHEAACGLDFIDDGSADPTAFAAATRVVFPNAWPPRDLYSPWLTNATWSLVPTAIPVVPGIRRQRELDGRFRLVHVGSVERRRGQDLTLRALAALGDERVELRFVGADQGPWAQRVKQQLAKHQKVDASVTWCGGLPHEQALQEIADADAMVLPTRDDNLPLVVLEAMSLGVPVICARLGGLAGSFTDGAEVLFVPPDDSKALVRAIQRLRCEPGLAARLAETAQRHVADKRCYDAFVQAMEAELHAAVDTFHCRAGA